MDEKRVTCWNGESEEVWEETDESRGRKVEERRSGRVRVERVCHGGGRRCRCGGETYVHREWSRLRPPLHSTPSGRAPVRSFRGAHLCRAVKVMRGRVAVTGAILIMLIIVSLPTTVHFVPTVIHRQRSGSAEHSGEGDEVDSDGKCCGSITITHYLPTNHWCDPNSLIPVRTNLKGTWTIFISINIDDNVIYYFTAFNLMIILLLWTLR